MSESDTPSDSGLGEPLSIDVKRDITTSDPELIEIIESWPKLPASWRAALLATIRNIAEWSASE